MKKVFRRILAVSMTFVLLASAGCSKKKSSSIEGSGYDSPEKAATAFAEALKKKDTEKMLSTFAVETYCENYSAYLNMVRLQTLSFSSMYTEPLSPEGDTYLHEANVYNRAGNLARNIELLYSNIIVIASDSAFQETYEMLDNGRPISVTERENMESAREILDTLTSDNDLDIDVGEVYPAESLSENFYDGRIANSYYAHAKVRNADGYTSLAIALTVNGQEILVTMDTIKYGKKWYVSSLGGLLSMSLGQSSTVAGLISAEEIEEKGLLQNTKKNVKNSHKEIEDLKDKWDKEHEQYMEEYEDLTDGLSKKEIDELIFGDDWKMDPRCNVYSLSYDEMLEFFDIDLD